jgi:hypothetical protein
VGAIAQQIKENDVVELRETVGDWSPGTSGTVVSDYGDVKLVEISNDRGEMLDLPLIPASNLELVAKYSN